MDPLVTPDVVDVIAWLAPHYLVPSELCRGTVTT